jgi:hypothetical protein
MPASVLDNADIERAIARRERYFSDPVAYTLYE